MEPQPFHPLDYLTVVNRRKWWFVVPLVLCLAAGAVAVAVWPRTYLSKAAIGVQSPTLSVDLLRTMSSMDPVERQRAIQQLLLSPTVLDRVIREERIGVSKPVDEAAASLRANLLQNIEVPPTLGLNGRPDPTRGIDLFYVGYTDKDPGRAQRVANKVASVFVEENSKFQTNRAENSADVLEQQVATSQARLSELENKLRAKKQTYVGRLPDQVGANVQMVNGARSQLESISMQIRGEQERLSMLESQVDQMRRGSGAESMTSTGLAASQQAQKRIDDLEAQLAADRALGYTDKHPDIERLQREITQARADAAASKVIPPANLPDSPIEPQPLKIMALAVIAGLVLGAGAALGREFMDRSVHDSRALETEFEVPVLGEIPRIPA